MADVLRSGFGPIDWFQLIEDLALMASAVPAAQQQAYLESLLRLLAMAPMQAERLGYVQPDAKRLFAFIETGAWESAALSLLPADAGFMASRGPDQNHVVSVVLRGADQESTSSGSTLGLAIVSAFALAIADRTPAIERWGATGKKFPGPDLGQVL